jgi:hypothetical protein
VVVSTAAYPWTDNRRPWPVEICSLLNQKLTQSPHSQVRLSAARWTVRGNLVLWGGPNNTLAHMTLALPLLSETLQASFSAHSTSSPTNPPKVRPNIKWSKLLINRVPTGTSPSREAYTPEECHEALLAENPTYASLTITQLPSWVRPPASYSANAVSSLSLAFEDPDGSRALAMLKDKTLFAFGQVAVVKKWKQKPPPPKPIMNTAAGIAAAAPHPSAPKRPPTSPPQAVPRPAKRRGPRNPGGGQ